MAGAAKAPSANTATTTNAMKRLMVRSSPGRSRVASCPRGHRNSPAAPLAIFAMITALRRLGMLMDRASAAVCRGGSAVLGRGLLAQRVQRRSHRALALAGADHLERDLGPRRRATHAPGEAVGTLDRH